MMKSLLEPGQVVVYQNVDRIPDAVVWLESLLEADLLSSGRRVVRIDAFQIIDRSDGLSFTAVAVVDTEVVK